MVVSHNYSVRKVVYVEMWAPVSFSHIVVQVMCVVRKHDACESEGKGFQSCVQPSSLVWCRNLGNNERTRSPTRTNEMIMLRWMCGVTRRDQTEMNTLEGQKWCKRP